MTDRHPTLGDIPASRYRNNEVGSGALNPTYNCHGLGVLASKILMVRIKKVGQAKAKANLAWFQVSSTDIT